MRSKLWKLFGIGWAILWLGVLGSAQPVEEPAQVLLVTQAAGYKHEVLDQAARTLQIEGPGYGLEFTLSRDLSKIPPQQLAIYDGIVFYTSGELPLSQAQKDALLDFVRSGKGFAGIHSATDTFYEWPEYGELIGAYFGGHPWSGEKVGIVVEDLEHPATEHLGIYFSLIDEIYQFKNFSRQGKHVLMGLDITSVDMAKPGVKTTDRDFALAWTKRYGQGRVFYTALGHFPKVWESKAFQQHVLMGIRWSIGRE